MALLVPTSLGQATLPSVVAAEKLFNGESWGLLAVLASTVGRAGVIGAGLFLAGEREHLLRNACAGALAIETFVLIRVGYQVRAERALQSQAK